MKTLPDRLKINADRALAVLKDMRSFAKVQHGRESEEYKRVQKAVNALCSIKEDARILEKDKDSAYGYITSATVDEITKRVAERTPSVYVKDTHHHAGIKRRWRFGDDPKEASFYGQTKLRDLVQSILVEYREAPSTEAYWI